MRAAIALMVVLGAWLGFAGKAIAQFLPPSFYDGGTHDIRRGGALGVDIGMDRATARKALEKHWNIRFHYADDCRPPGAWYCEGAQAIDRYNASGDILGGVIEVFLVNGRVVRMRWWRHAFDP